jgi:hypothetical protein
MSLSPVPPVIPVPPIPVLAPNPGPTAPLMGGLQDENTPLPIAWTGGQPMPDWSGLKVPRLSSPYLGCLHPARSSDKSKAYHYRSVPNASLALFKKGGNLQAFSRETHDHFKQMGMDTLMYTPSIQHPTTDMVNAVLHFDRTMQSHVTSHVAILKPKWDKYDLENDQAAYSYILKRLDPDLRAEVILRLPEGADGEEGEDGTAIELWMQVISQVQDVSMERFNHLQDSLKLLSLLTQPGENVTFYVNQALRICTELDRANQWEWNLTLSILTALTKSTV